MTEPVTEPTPKHHPESHAMSNDQLPAMLGPRIFVTVVFAVLAAAFVASTGVFIYEFREQDWPALLLLHSHLFLFFPTLGIVALVAFHLPATVFTHMYWTHIPRGGLRFTLGGIAVVAGTAWFSLGLLNSGPRELWEVTPAALTRDRAEPASCGDGRGACKRVSLLDGMTSLRAAAESRFGVSKFARVCRPDPLLEVPDEFTRERFCFATGGKLGADACCQAQARYGTAIDTLWSDPANRSLTDRFDLIALPLKTFFVIVVVVIGVLLAIWRKLLEARYAPIAPAIERALLIGAAAMLPWPFMDYAHAQAMQTLAGRWTAGLQPRLSLVIAPWALLLLIFFLARMGRKIERLGQLAGAGASVIAVLRYEQLNDAAVRTLGAGAPLWLIPLLLAACVFALTMLRWPRHLQRAINGVVGRPPDEGTERAPPFFKKRTRSERDPVDL